MGCSSKGKITNAKLQSNEVAPYEFFFPEEETSGKTAILLSFSGGGTRAAALSYGVLKGLRDLEYDNTQLRRSNMLNQVVAISSVSGGSFTAAYYGLYGEQIFESFEEDFLYFDISGGLLNLFLKPKHLFSINSRTTGAANFYNERLFKGKTFGDIRHDSPDIIINASDLGSGNRFSFIQEQFDFICSDVNAYSVSDAVAASSAVPIVFQPVVLKNYSECENSKTSDPSNIESPHALSTLKGLKSYADKEKRPYIHLVDGGITDNLGLLAFSDTIQKEAFLPHRIESTVDTIIVISVDASAHPKRDIDHFVDSPAVSDTIDAVTDIQLHRYNDLSQQLIIDKLAEWKNNQSGRTTVFIDINLQSSTRGEFMNSIPTDFKLEKNQVDALIQHGYDEISYNPSLNDIQM